MASRISPLNGTPPFSLTSTLPPGEDATVLVLGPGDPRNVLFTAYSETGLPPRKLDVTWCCDNEFIVARNTILLSLLVSNGPTASDKIWEAYFDLYVSDESIDLVKTQAQRLVDHSQSLDDWHKSEHGRLLPMSDETSLALVRGVWCTYTNLEPSKPQRDQYDEDIRLTRDSVAQSSLEEDGDVVLAAFRSAAPLCLDSRNNSSMHYKKYWDQYALSSQEDLFPNPTFLAARTPLHPATNPFAGFHMATSYARLTENSPLHPTSEANACRVQFREWVLAFQSMAGERLKIRQAVADPLVFCNTLQIVLSPEIEDTSANLHRRFSEWKPYKPDRNIYKTAQNAPHEFDIIDTLNTADRVCPLELLMTCSFLLRYTPSSTLYLETSERRQLSFEKQLRRILSGDASTVSLILGLFPVEYWTNSTLDSHLDEMFISIAGVPTAATVLRNHFRTSWKFTSQCVRAVNHLSRLQLQPQELAKLLFGIYTARCLDTKTTSITEASSADSLLSARTLVMVMKLALQFIVTPVETALKAFFELVLDRPETNCMRPYLQEFYLEAHLQKLEMGPFAGAPDSDIALPWPPITGCRVLNVVIPDIIKDHPLANADVDLELVVVQTTPTQEKHRFTNVHLIRGPDTVEDMTLASDQACVACYVPLALVEADQTRSKVELTIRSSLEGEEVVVFQTTLDNSSHVLVTEYMPGTSGHPVIGFNMRCHDDRDAAGSGQTLTAEVSDDGDSIKSLTLRIDIQSSDDKELLTDRMTQVELLQDSIFGMKLAVGQNGRAVEARFPWPVSRKAVRKWRVARKSGWFDITVGKITDLEDQLLGLDTLPEMILPIVLSGHIPVNLSIGNVSLDTLSTLSNEEADRKANSWLSTLVSQQFSPRERQLRAESSKMSVRQNFKESLFTMFMVASGIQGGQTGLFALELPGQGNQILIFFRSICIDGSNGSVLADAAVLPLTRELIDGGELETFLLVLRTLEICSIPVDGEELGAWKGALCSWAERCRTWAHTSECEYRADDANVPLTAVPGKQFMCSCGQGKLPVEYMGLPEWEQASRHAVRVAISPLFSSPAVEPIVERKMIGIEGGIGALLMERCRQCGATESDNGGDLRKCTACRNVAYCSETCQRSDWKKHRMECT